MGEGKLRRSLSLWQVTFYGIGVMIGAGIYVLVGKVAGIAGMMAPFAFLVAGLLAGLTAYSYAELTSRYPKSAGEVVYVRKAFSSFNFSVLIGWMILLTGVVSAAGILNGFTGYLDVFIEIPHWLTITVLVLLLSGVALVGIGESVGLVVVMTVVEICGLIFVVILAGDSLGDLPERLPEMIPDFSGESITVVFAAAFLAFYAFVGFEDLANVAEEVKDPVRTMPKAILIALAISTVLYILVALVAVLSLPADQLAASDAPLALILAKKGPNFPLIISAVSLVAVLNGALAQIIMGSRVVYGMAEQKMAPGFFAKVLPKQQTPALATVGVAAGVLVLALWFPLVPLAIATSFLIIFVFAAVNLSLIMIKRKEKRPEGVINVPYIVPILGFLMSLLFLVYETVSLIGGG